MHITAAIFGCAFLASVLLDAFQTIILPRRPVGRLRITRFFFLLTWGPWCALTRAWPVKKSREQMYSIYGPMALLLLFVTWALLLVVAYALIYFGLSLPFTDPWHPALLLERVRSCLYVSGTTLFTLGLGDVQPATTLARELTVLEAGTGLGFVALVIGYVPVLYNAFSSREVPVAMLDARAGSPPTAGELLLRHNFSGGHEALTALLAEWERWSAEMLETHVSYPILCYYRSQHDNQSWLAAITAILDTCALVITTVEGPSTRQAQLTFAIARHTLVDLGHVFHREKVEARLRTEPPTRLGDEEYARLSDLLCEAGFSLCRADDVQERLLAIRKLYEPHAESMAAYLGLTLPRWAPPPRDPSKKPDGWVTVAGLRYSAALADRLGSHVSEQSTANRLGDADSHPF
ncbi:potassium channel family protein [Granulicella paludicola]|uniref:potassium channel family protein n=1 Tax=Granulicella paludicola TaxID=474951 RepID=UPI0021DFDA51|nr:potassium channel family protein [Granulicella paludicola]